MRPGTILIPKLDKDYFKKRKLQSRRQGSGKSHTQNSKRKKSQKMRKFQRPLEHQAY